MTTKGLILKTQLDVAKSEEDIALTLDENKVFDATLLRDYLAISWRVNPNGTKQDYLKKLLEVLLPVPLTVIGSRPKPNFDPFIYLTHANGAEELSIDQLDGNAPQLLHHPHFRDFVLLRTYTAYLDFTLEDHTGPWKPETGLISVISHNDLSQPVARLISETARYSVPAEQLQLILAEKVYRFKKCQPSSQSLFSA